MMRFLYVVLISCVFLNFIKTEIIHASFRSFVTRGEFLENQILVKFKDGITERECIKIHKNCGAKSFRTSYKKDYHVVTIENGAVEKMIRVYLKTRKVKYAEPNYVVHAYFTPDDELFESQWHLSQINCEDAWDTCTGDGVVVAVLDTGVNTNGFDSFGGRVIQGRDFANKDDDSSDDNGHGTHVAGTIAQSTNNGIGVAGVAFDATILSVKILGRFGRGNTNFLIDGINWAADNGAQIINLSLGSPFGSNILEETVNDVHDNGVVIVAAAGNEGRGAVSFPAAYDSVIAVGSVRLDESLSSFSNTGPEIDIVAPGGDTSEDHNNDGFADGVLQETFRKGFFFRRNELTWDFTPLQGTSFSCPHVAGVAALLLEKNPSMTPEEVRNAITSTAKDLGDSGKDDRFGWGLIDASAVSTFLQ